MRVLIVSYLNLNYGGGGEVWIGEVARRWAGTHEVSIITTSFGERRSRRLKLPEGVRVDEISTVPGTTLPTPSGFRRLANAFHDSDVIYFNYSAGGLELATLALQQLTRVPVIAGHHGALEWAGTEPGIGHIKLLFALLGPRNIRVGRYFAAHHVQNRHDLALLTGFGVMNLFNIPGAISCDEFGPAPKRPAFTMTFAGSFAPQKGVDRFPQIIRLVRERVPEARFEFCGNGPFRGFLQELQGVPGVSYLGFLGVTDMHRLVSSAHVYLLPSRHETFSKAAMEALASGTPVVAMRVPGVEDYLIDGQNGYLADTVEDFASAVQRVFALWSTDRTGYERFSRRCVETAREYDWALVGPRFDALLTQVAHR
jgi:glycosyltransferase involved in cell wall biosynthesis